MTTNDGRARRRDGAGGGDRSPAPPVAAGPAPPAVVRRIPAGGRADAPTRGEAHGRRSRRGLTSRRRRPAGGAVARRQRAVVAAPRSEALARPHAGRREAVTAAS